METATRLRQLVAPLAGVAESELRRGSQLGGRLKTSIGRATLDALLRREFGFQGPAVFRVATYGELEDAVLPRPATEHPAPEDAPRPAGGESELRQPSGANKGPESTIRCGID